MCFKIGKNSFLFAYLVLSFFLSNSLSLSQFSKIYIDGIIRDENSKAPIKGVIVSVLHEQIERIQTESDGRYSFSFNRPSSDSIYILYYDPIYITKIRCLSVQDYRDETTNLEPKYTSTNERTINGYVYSSLSTSDETISIDSVEVFANEGRRRGISTEEGKFDIIISMDNNPSFTYLWLEKKGYKTKVIRTSDISSEVRINLAPLAKLYHLNFTVLRGDIRRGIQNVEIFIEDEFIGSTNQFGKLSVSYNLVYDKKRIGIKYKHRWFLEKTMELELENQELPVTIELEPLLQEVKVRVYYFSTRGTIEGIPQTTFEINREGLTGLTDNYGGASLRFQAIHGDTLWLTLPHNRGFYPERSTVILNENQKEYNVRVDRKHLEVKIYTVDPFNKPIIDAGALKFECKDYTQNVTGENGEYKFQCNLFNPGDEVIVNSLSNKYHQPRELKIKISEDITSYSRTLVLSEIQNIGTLNVESDPDSAQVYIDNHKQSHRTPIKLELNEGYYEVKVVKEGYLPKIYRVSISPNKLVELKINLEQEIQMIEPPKRIRISTDIGALTWIFKYPKIIPVPSPRIGGQLYYYPTHRLGIRFIYFGSKIPTYYFSQEIGLGILLRMDRGELSASIKDNYFESTKELLTKFEGVSGEINFLWCLGSEKYNDNGLPFLKNYRYALQFGFEGSFKTMNKSLENRPDHEPKPERQIYIGCKKRYHKSILELNLVWTSPKIKMVDEDKDKVIGLRIIRINLDYSYFWN